MHCECVQTKDEDMVPLTINCWPSISGNESYVNIEYECQAEFDLQSIVVAIPCPQPPKVNQVGDTPGSRSSAIRLARVHFPLKSLDMCMCLFESPEASAQYTITSIQHIAMARERCILQSYGPFLACAGCMGQ